MGKTGNALQNTLNAYRIGYSQLAEKLQVDPSTVFGWCHGITDPTGETIAAIAQALHNINPDAARDFVRSFLGDVAGDSVSESDDLLIAPAPALPESDRVSVATLAQLLGNTTNSYKYLFLLSLLDILKRRQFDVLSPISFEELTIEMLANAWYPHTYFRLSFGRQDCIADKLDALVLNITEPILKFTDTDKRLLRQAIQAQKLGDVVSFIRQYVLFRLIRPFFQAETKGLKDAQINQQIASLAAKEFNTRKPLYCFDALAACDCKVIVLHQDWIDYLAENFAIVRGWVAWEWLQYMQRRNPSTPNLVSKLFAPQHRGSLSKPTKLWNVAIQRHDLRCIYSGKLLNAGHIAIDHFLPWSFVAHDLPWNLIPTTPEVNSSKSNHLPSLQYFDDFVSLQHLGLMVARETMTPKTWENHIEPYIADLQLTADSLLERDLLRRAYELTLQPLLSLASQQGFSSDWVYRV
jgi:transcriptional regulator with XRE-family HTH domain